MKIFAALCLLALPTAAIAQTPAATVVSAAQVRALSQAAAAAQGTRPNSLKPIIAIPGYTLNLEHRVARAPAAVHPADAEWLIVLDGATYLLLVLILVCSYALPNANALKTIILVATTVIAIAMFWSKGDVWLAEGIVLSVGSILGGHFGAKLSSHPSARQWAFRLLVVAIGLELVHLGWHYTASWRAEI